MNIKNMITRNQKELTTIVNEHEILLETEGEYGEFAILDGFNFYGCDISNTDLTGARMRHSFSIVGSGEKEKIGLTANRAFMRSADLNGVHFEYSNFKHAIFFEAAIKDALFKHSSFFETSFDYSNLEELTAYHCDFSEASFSHANLDHASFRDCNLTGCSFEGANNEWAYFSNCNLTNADLHGLELKDYLFVNCKMTGALVDEQYRHLLNQNKVA